MKRHNLLWTGAVCEDPSGKWVQYEDARAVIDGLQAMLDERDELTDAYSTAIAASNELGYAGMDAACVIRHQGEQLSSAREFVRSLVDGSSGQNSIATGYLSDILERLL